MTISPQLVRVTPNEGRAMNTLFTVVVLAFVLAVLTLVAYALYEVSPFARHAERFRDPRTGKRRWESPHLD
jgi:Na+-transporting methylmalonyl-CoA/oxaloacetate decarboxylase gamma subunit